MREGGGCHSIPAGFSIGNGINDMHPPAQPQTYSYLIGGAVLVLVLALRFRSVGRHRRLKLGALWVMPAILVALGALTFISAPPSPATVGLCALALLIGSAAG